MDPGFCREVSHLPVHWPAGKQTSVKSMSSPKRRAELTIDVYRPDANWTVCLVRWVLLFGIVLVALFDPVHHLPGYTLGQFLVGFGAYSLSITIFLAMGLFIQVIPPFALVVDTLALLVLINLSGGTDSPFFFFAIFPILVATLQFSWQAGLLTTMIFILNQGVRSVLAWDAGRGAAQLYQPGLHAMIFLWTFLVAAVASKSAVAPGALTGHRQPGKDPDMPEDFRMIYEMASTLSATLNYERVLESILDISRMGFIDLGHRVGESIGMVFLYDRKGQLFVASHRNLMSRDDENQHLNGSSGIVGQAIATAQAVIGEEPAADPEISIFNSLKQAKSMLCVPLRAGFETYGAVLFASIKPNAFTQEHLELLTIFCNQATIALQNASLYQSLREERDKIVDKEEEARRKLARDLHDGPTQDVAAIAMRLNFARLLIERDPARARVELERLEDLAHRTVKEIRSMLFTLRPIILETEGLVAALNQYADNLRENDNLPVEVDAERYSECLDSDAQGVVFAILEEAVNNAKKHAQASRIWIRLSVENDLFVAQVADNGRGFDVKSVERSYGTRGSLGLLNLKERAELVDGTLNIESAPGQGTRITLLVPISQEPI
jgi:signal transduction histidine kinase